MLIIYAHPNKHGHCGYILNMVTEKLNKAKIDFEILDLYEMNYDPILKQEEHYTSGNYKISEANKIIQEKIKNTDKFIFIYPTWWQNMPAILKGFLDRVFTPKFAYEFVNKLPKKLLKGKALIFTTTGGPRIFTYFIAKDRAIKVLTRDTLNFCGIKTKSYIIGNSHELTDNQKNIIDKKIQKAFKFILS